LDTCLGTGDEVQLLVDVARDRTFVLAAAHLALRPVDKASIDLSAVEIVAAGDRQQPSGDLLFDQRRDDVLDLFNLAIGIFEADPVGTRQADRDEAAVLFGNQFLAKGCKGKGCREDDNAAQTHDHERHQQDAVEGLFVNPREASANPAQQPLDKGRAGLLGKFRGQHGNDRKGDERRDADRDGENEAEFAEQPSGGRG